MLYVFTYSCHSAIERLKHKERSTLCIQHVCVISTFIYVSMGMALNVTGALPINQEDLYVIDNNSLITGFYSTIYG